MVTEQTIRTQISQANKFLESIGLSALEFNALSQSEQEIKLEQSGKPIASQRRINDGIIRLVESSQEIKPLTIIRENINSFSNEELQNNFNYHNEAAKRLKLEIEQRKYQEQEEQEEQAQEQEGDYLGSGEPSNFFHEKELKNEESLKPSPILGLGTFYSEISDKGIRFESNNPSGKPYEILDNLHKYAEKGMMNDIKGFKESNDEIGLRKMRISIKYTIKKDSELHYFSSKKLPPRQAIFDIKRKITALTTMNVALWMDNYQTKPIQETEEISESDLDLKSIESIYIDYYLE